jgi:hypothetical protein
MRAPAVLLFLLSLGGCGSGGGGSDGGAQSPVSPVGSTTTRYTSSQPLVDNTGRDAFNVLLIGNSHAIGLRSILQTVLRKGQPNKTSELQVAPGSKYLADRVADGRSEQSLESTVWSHVILQAQKYSSSGTVDYTTTAAEYWIRGSKGQGATPILFPEHPQRGNTREGPYLYDLHSAIAQREPACVAPVGLVWDEVVQRDRSLVLHQEDGNHASPVGLYLSALVFYQIITGQPADTIPNLSGIGIERATQQMLKETATYMLLNFPPCNYEVWG